MHIREIVISLLIFVEQLSLALVLVLKFSGEVSDTITYFLKYEQCVCRYSPERFSLYASEQVLKLKEIHCMKCDSCTRSAFSLQILVVCA